MRQGCNVLLIAKRGGVLEYHVAYDVAHAPPDRFEPLVQSICLVVRRIFLEIESGLLPTQLHHIIP